MGTIDSSIKWLLKTCENLCKAIMKKNSKKALEILNPTGFIIH